MDHDFELAYQMNPDNDLLHVVAHGYIKASLEIADDLKGQKVLDIGGGPRSILLSTVNSRESRIIDPVNYPLHIAGLGSILRGRGITFQHGTLEEDGSSEEYDEVWCYNVITHTETPVEFIRAMLAKVKDGGVLRFMEPLIQPYDGHPTEVTPALVNIIREHSREIIKESVVNYQDHAFSGDHLVLIARIGKAAVEVPKPRLHILGIPHTCTTPEYSHCAFTGKVLRFSPMMRSVGYEVIHYGNGGQNPGASKHVPILSEEELEDYKKAILGESYAAGSTFVGALADMGNAVYKEFNRRLKARMQGRLRPGDIICCPFGAAHEPAIAGFSNIKVETGIGYNDPYLPYRIYETDSWYQYIAGKQGVAGGNYWFVVPNYFDVEEWDLNLTPRQEVVYLGRLQEDKGLRVVMEIAKHRPDLQFTLCGQGDPTPFLIYPNIRYKEPIHGKDRSAYLGGALCTLMPTQYNEPFGGVAVESQLCGTPVLTTSYGCFKETVQHGLTGYRCHTLGDFLAGLENIEKGTLDRRRIREIAKGKYGMYAVALQYDEVFDRLCDLHGDGWYSLKKRF